MRSNALTPSTAQQTTTTSPAGTPLVLTTPRTLRGLLVSVLVAVVAMTALFSPVLAALFAQAVVLARFVGPPAAAALTRRLPGRASTNPRATAGAGD